MMLTYKMQVSITLLITNAFVKIFCSSWHKASEFQSSKIWVPFGV